MPIAKSRLSTVQQVNTIWDLGGLTPAQLAKRILTAINEADLLGRASELAFNLVLAIFPMLLFLLALLGIFASRGPVLRASLLEYFAEALPPPAFHIVSQTLTEVTSKAGGGKLTFGIVLTLWFASGGMNSMISVLNGAYRLKETRSWFRVRAIAFVLTGCIALLVMAALAVVLTGGYVTHVVGAYLGFGNIAIAGWSVLQWPIAFAFLGLSFSLIYYFGPDVEEQHWYWITPGSLFGVLLWLAVSFGFRAYLHFFNSYSKTYGSLGAVMILLMWLYVTGLAFLIGGEINAQIEHAAAVRGHPEAKAPGEKKTA